MHAIFYNKQTRFMPELQLLEKNSPNVEFCVCKLGNIQILQ